jgi:hypothetical protein
VVPRFCRPFFNPSAPFSEVVQRPEAPDLRPPLLRWFYDLSPFLNPSASSSEVVPRPEAPDRRPPLLRWFNDLSPFFNPSASSSEVVPRPEAPDRRSPFSRWFHDLSHFSTRRLPLLRLSDDLKLLTVGRLCRVCLCRLLDRCSYQRFGLRTSHLYAAWFHTLMFDVLLALAPLLAALYRDALFVFSTWPLHCGRTFRFQYAFDSMRFARRVLPVL